MERSTCLKTRTFVRASRPTRKLCVAVSVSMCIYMCVCVYIYIDIDIDIDR
jgi:hypothetical protein